MRKRRPWLWLIGGVCTGTIVFLLFRRTNVTTLPGKYSYGRPNTAKLSRDPAKLLPAFADRLELLFQRMRARNFDPVLHEGYRTPERARELSKSGIQASALSMHSYGAAADIISASKQWSDPAFFRALGEEARAVGLTWGGDWDGDGVREAGEDDLNHVQAVPSTNVAQNAVRNAADPNAVVMQYLA